MSVTLVIVLNALVAAVVVGSLAYVSRIPYRLERSLPRREVLKEAQPTESPAYEQAA